MTRWKLAVFAAIMAIACGEGLDTHGLKKSGTLTARLDPPDQLEDGKWIWGHPGLTLVVTAETPPTNGTFTVRTNGPAAFLNSENVLTREDGFPLDTATKGRSLLLEVANTHGELDIAVEASGPVSTSDPGPRRWHKSVTVEPALVNLHQCVVTDEAGCSEDAGVPISPDAGCTNNEETIECAITTSTATWRGINTGIRMDVPPLPETSGTHTLEFEAFGAVALAAGQRGSPITLGGSAKQQNIVRFLNATGEGVGIFRARIVPGPFTETEIRVARGFATLRRATLTGYRNLEAEVDVVFCSFHLPSAPVTFSASAGTVLGAGSSGNELLVLSADSECPAPSSVGLRARWRGTPGSLVWTTAEGPRRASQPVDLSQWKVDSVELMEASRERVPEGFIVALELRRNGPETKKFALKSTIIDVRPLAPSVSVERSTTQDASRIAGATRIQTDEQGRFVINIDNPDAGAEALDAGTSHLTVFVAQDIGLVAKY